MCQNFYYFKSLRNVFNTLSAAIYGVKMLLRTLAIKDLVKSFHNFHGRHSEELTNMTRCLLP